MTSADTEDPAGQGPPDRSWRLGLDDRSQPSGRVVALVLADLLERFRAREPGVRAGVDPEELHQMRVALRRARSVVASARRVLPAEERRLLDALLGEFAAVTSPLRDLDVALMDLDDLVDGLGPVAGAGADDLRAEVRRRRDAAHRELVTVLDGDLYRVLVRRWHSLGSVYRVGGSEPGPDALRPAGEVVDDLLLDGARDLRRRGRRAAGSEDLATWHSLRKRTKRFRYLLTEVAPLYPKDPLRKVLRHLGRLQDALGVLQDHAAQLELFADAGRAAGGDAGLTAGALLARLEVSAEDTREQCVRAWERYEDSSPVKRVRRAVEDAAG